MIYRRSHPAFASSFDRAVEHMLHCDRIPRVAVDEKSGMKLGGKYNWKGQPERLVYLGRNWSGNGYWHQFEKVEAPGVVWCEVLDGDLHMLEETSAPNNIVERLRNAHTSLGHSLAFGLVAEAADLIEQQATKIAELEEAVRIRTSQAADLNALRYTLEGKLSKAEERIKELENALGAEVIAHGVVRNKLAAIRSKFENAEVVAWNWGTGVKAALIRKEDLL